MIPDLPAPALVHEPLGAALDSPHPVYRAHLRMLQLDIIALLKRRFVLRVFFHCTGLL